MKYFCSFIMLVFSAHLSFNQTTVSIEPAKDVSVGFHDGYPSADENFWNASHFSAFSQPAAGGGGGENAGWGLIAFDLGLIPDGATITEATLDLFAFGTGFSGPLPYGHDGDNASWLCRITEDWDEMEVTWNTKPEITDVDQVILPASTDPNEDYLGIDVKTLIQYFTSHPAENFGLAIRLQDESPTAGLMFHSSDYADESKWPTLHVTYTEQTQEIITAGEMNSIIISPNPTSEFINIKYQLNLQNNSLTIKLFNSTGQEIYTIAGVNGNNQINIQKLPAGIYTVVIQDKETEQIFSSTFVKN